TNPESREGDWVSAGALAASWIGCCSVCCEGRGWPCSGITVTIRSLSPCYGMHGCTPWLGRYGLWRHRGWRHHHQLPHPWMGNPEVWSVWYRGRIPGLSVGPCRASCTITIPPRMGSCQSLVDIREEPVATGCRPAAAAATAVVPIPLVIMLTQQGVDLGPQRRTARRLVPVAVGSRCRFGSVHLLLHAARGTRVPLRIAGLEVGVDARVRPRGLGRGPLDIGLYRLGELRLLVPPRFEFLFDGDAGLGVEFVERDGRVNAHLRLHLLDLVIPVLQLGQLLRRLTDLVAELRVRLLIRDRLRRLVRHIDGVEHAVHLDRGRVPHARVVTLQLHESV